MKIVIGKPCAVSEKGGRANNEDCVYPSSECVDSNQRLFLVCDGVGGAARGEVASALACDAMQTFFDTFLDHTEPSTDFIQRAVHYSETHFDTYLQAHPEAAGMATTLALAYVGKERLTLAHIGDSRIYYLRNGRVLYRSEDHSVVNSLVRLGRITPEEAHTHPQRHQILRAIQGSHRSTEADVIEWDDIQPGDWLFLCSDGVLEQLDESLLSQLFVSSNSPAEIKEQILELCAGKTRDNYSFYLIPIQKVEGSTSFEQNFLSFLYSLA